MCDNGIKKRRYVNWPRQVVSESKRGKTERRPKKRTNIVAKFLPQGFRFLRPRERVKKTDFFWSYMNKCYLPATKRQDEFAGITIPFIRRIGND